MLGLEVAMCANYVIAFLADHRIRAKQLWCQFRRTKTMSGVGNETDKKSKLRAIQDWTTERIGDVRWQSVRLNSVLLLGLKPLVLENLFKWNGGKAEILSDFVAHSIIYLNIAHCLPWLPCV